MALRDIRRYPDEVLSRAAEPVESIDEELLRLIDDMVETMYAASGVGLAAPQVGVSKRLIVVDASRGEEGGEAPLIVLVNPEIVDSRGEVKSEEGCLSLPGFTANIKRAGEVTVRYLDRQGREAAVDATGLLAIALQHEIDHLEGRLILDRASALKREFYRKRIKKSPAKAG
ncbi:MAG: peptide deformylase [Nitrospirota bacterium]